MKYDAVFHTLVLSKYALNRECTQLQRNSECFAVYQRPVRSYKFKGTYLLLAFGTLFKATKIGPV